MNLQKGGLNMNKNQAKKATVSELYQYYCRLRNPKMEKPSIYSRDTMYRIHILPHFGKDVLSKISIMDIEEWQGIILKNPDIGNIRKRNIHDYFSSLFNFCELRFGISPNPCRIAGAIGSKEPHAQMKTWSADECTKVTRNISSYELRTAIELLFWTGIRKGELYGLTARDFCEFESCIDINKQYQRRAGGTYEIIPPKYNSCRIIGVPKVFAKKLAKYIKWKRERDKNFKDTDFLFTWTKRGLENAMREGEAKGKVKRIRVHDLRHSHATHCMDSMVNIVAISKRLGHRRVSTTVNKYAHLREQHNKELVDWLNNQFIKHVGDQDDKLVNAIQEINSSKETINFLINSADLSNKVRKKWKMRMNELYAFLYSHYKN